MILVHEISAGACAWATSAPAMGRPATGLADNETLAYLCALETFLDHPNHAGRPLTIRVEDTPGGQELIAFAAQHLPHVTVAPRLAVHTHDLHERRSLSKALSEFVAPLTTAQADGLGTPKTPVRIVAAIATSGSPGQPLTGWSWVTSDGRCRADTLSAETRVAADVLAMLRLLATHRRADSIHIGCTSMQAAFMIERLRDRTISVVSTRKQLGLTQRRHHALFDALLQHQATITFQWLNDDPRQLLASTAERLALQARRARQWGMDREAYAELKARIMDEFLSSRPE